MEKIVSGLQDFLKGRVKFAFLFGSALTKYFNEESDIDVAVYLGRSLDLRERLEFQHDMSAHLAHQREIDLVVLDDADPIIAMQVLANGKLIVDQDHFAFITFKSLMISRYLDFKMDRRIIEDKIVEGSVYA